MAPAWGSEDHRSRLQHVLSRLSAAEELHKRLVPVWLENYRAFRALPTSATPRDKEDWQSDVRSPYVAEQVLTMQPRLVEGRPSVDVLRQDPSTPQAWATTQARYLSHNLWLDQFPMKAARAALHTILFGVGWSKQSYLYEKRTRDIVNRVTGECQATPLIISNRPTTSIPHPINAMHDPTAETFETARFLIFRTVTTVGQVRGKERKLKRTPDPNTATGYREEWVGIYSNTEYVTGGGRTGQKNESKFPNQLDPPDEPSYVKDMVKGQRVELLEVLDKELDRVFVVANRCVLIRDQRMPWWHGEIPAACAVTTPDVGTLHGIAEVDWIRPLQEMLWLLENQKLDNTRLQMDMVLLVRDTLMDLDDYQLAPGAKWPVTNMDDVQVLQYAQPQLASMGDIESIRGRLQAIIGSAFMTGGDSSAMGVNQETASGLMSIIEEGNRRVDFRMNLMRMFYERILQQQLSDAAQFLEDSIFVPAASRGADPIPVSPDVLAAKGWVRVTLGSETGNRSFKQQMAAGILQAAQGFKGTPIPTEQGMRVFNEKPLVEIMAEAWDREPEEFLFDPATMQQVQQAQAPMGAIDQSMQAAAGNPTQVAMPGAAFGG
jgi:hypothetical protein